MGIADIPTSLGPSFLIRSFLPGYIASLLYYFAYTQLENKPDISGVIANEGGNPFGILVPFQTNFSWK